MSYPNGQIPTSAMIRVQSAYFMPECAKAMAAAIAECANYGIHVNINEGYRPLGIPSDRNVRDERKTSTGGSNQFYQAGRADRGETPSAATPGHSNHGAGIAADVNPGAGNPPSPKSSPATASFSTFRASHGMHIMSADQLPRLLMAVRCKPC
jgi:hypothetical protein